MRGTVATGAEDGLERNCAEVVLTRMGRRPSVFVNVPLAEQRRIVPPMAYEFLTEAWFAKVDEIIAAAGDLQIPAAMKAAVANIVVTSPKGDTQIHVKDGLFARGHRADAPTTLTLPLELARKIFIDADAAAGVQAFMAGEIKVDGEYGPLVAMQTVPPSEAQLKLSREIAKITA
jgi:hypothetical protein